MGAQRVALVTGGARRVGQAIVRRLADAGCDIALHYHRSHEDAAALQAELQSSGRRCTILAADLADPATPDRLVHDAVDQLGHLDILVNNAAVFGEMRIQDFSRPDWEHEMLVNLTAPAALAAAACPYLQATGRGKIVNICDIAAERPWPRHIAYCTSKAGLVALTRALARGLAPGIQVNGVSPGIAVFPQHYDQDTRQKLIEQVPLGRPGTPQDIAHAVCFLVEADYITGQIINVDGGRSIR
jgi:pteridine reductase